MSTTLPNTPITATQAVTRPPTPIISTIVPTSSPVPPAQQNDSSLTTLPTDGQSASVTTLWSTTFGLSNPTMPRVMMSSTVVQGIFGVGANYDPLIIAGLVLAALIFLFLLGALIYCCCVYCGATTKHPFIKQNASFQTIHQQRQPTRPIYLTASFTPEYSSSADDPAASVFLEQPLRLTVGAYAAGNPGYSGGTLATRSIAGSYPSRMHQQMIEPDVIVTRRPVMAEQRSVVVRTMPRKKHMYPADVMGVGNDVTYNTIRPTIVSRGTPITTLGDGYAIGHSLRSNGNNYGGGRSLLLYDDDPSPQIITLY